MPPLYNGEPKGNSRLAYVLYFFFCMRSDLAVDQGKMGWGGDANENLNFGEPFKVNLKRFVTYHKDIQWNDGRRVY